MPKKYDYSNYKQHQTELDRAIMGRTRIIEPSDEEIAIKDAEFERKVMEGLRIYRGEIRYMGDR